MEEDIYRSIELSANHQEFKGAVGNLDRSLHRIVQVSQNWNLMLTKELRNIRFEQSMSDPCILRKVTDGQLETVVVVHVDAILVGTKEASLVQKFKEPLAIKFKMKDLGEAKFDMGGYIQRDRAKRILKVNQHVYMKNAVATCQQVTGVYKQQ